MMLSLPVLASLLTVLQLGAAATHQSSPHNQPSELHRRGCVGSVKKFSDVATAKKCNTINVYAQTVPAEQTLDLSNLLSGTTVNIQGDVVFAAANWAGPLFIISGENVNFNGNGHTFDGQGEKLWDSLGGNGGKDKPKFLKVTHSGSFSNLRVINSPAWVFSVGNKKTLTISKVTIDNTAGDKILSKTGKKAGHNTDAFDVSATDLTIKDCQVYNQDDCLAINDGSNINFIGNTCSGGHGISIGSVKSGKNISNVKIINNKVIKSDNGIRIKTIYKATGASVKDVTYSGNTLTDITKFGVVIQQDYENGSPTGKPTNGVAIENVLFTGAKTTVSVGSKGQAVKVLCGQGSCKGNWDWSSLSVSNGKKVVSPSNVPIKNFKL